MTTPTAPPFCETWHATCFEPVASGSGIAADADQC